MRENDVSLRNQLQQRRLVLALPAPLTRPKRVTHPQRQVTQGRRVSISQCLETDRKQTGSPGVTTGFRFPRRHRRFPSEGSRSGYSAEGFPFLLTRLRQDWRGPALSLRPRRFWKEWQAETGGAELEPGEGPLPSNTRARPGSAGAGFLSVAHHGGEMLSRGR